MARPRSEQVMEQRKQRLKWGDPKLRMSVDSETVDRLSKSGLTPRWVNDDGKGRIERLQQRGYDFVTDESTKIGDDQQGNSDLGARVSRVVGTNKTGDPIRAYLMVQPSEFYNEDQEEKESVNAKVDEAIRRGEAGGPNETSFNDGKGNHTYIKKETRYQP